MRTTHWHTTKADLKDVGCPDCQATIGTTCTWRGPGLHHPCSRRRYELDRRSAGHWRCYVYRVRLDGVLLYVGIAVDPQRRLREHRRTASWWPTNDTPTVSTVGYTTRSEAEDAEAEAIIWQRPRFNVRRPRIGA